MISDSKIVVVFFMIMLFHMQYSSLRSQGKWNLTNCVNYAIKNNIDLNINANAIAKQKVSLYESKADLFPDLNIGSGLKYNYGRNIDGNTNNITFNKTMSNNYWLNSSLDLFRGFVKQNTIRYHKYQLLVEKQKKEQSKNTLIFDIVSTYYILLYSQGLVDVAEDQVSIAQLQYDRVKKLYNVGKESLIKVQDLKSQLIADKLDFTKAKNIAKDKLLELKQLLRLNNEVSFDIDTTINANVQIFENPPLANSLFENAVKYMPQIRQQEYLLKVRQIDYAMSKGIISPRLYMSVGINSYFFDGSNKDYSTQIKSNQNQYINFGLYVPIFNNAHIHSEIKRKNIEVNTQQLIIEKQKEELYNQIQKIYNNVEAAKDEYRASTELYKYSELALRNTSVKLEKGLASTTDFELAKHRFTSAKANLLKSKLSYIMYLQMLEFYKNGNWNHIL